MKIAFFTYTILEYGGGFEKFFIETTSKLKKYYPNLEISIISLDKRMTRRLHFLLSFFYFSKLWKNTFHNEKTNIIMKKLGGVKYIKCKSFKDLRGELCKYDVIYSKNEILEATVLKFFIGYKSMSSVILCCGTSFNYTITKSIQAKLHNLLYKGPIYKFLTIDVKAFHAKNSLDEIQLKRIFPNKKVIKIYNPFDFKEFRQKANKYKYDFQFNKSKFNIIWVGRLTEQKGVDDLVQIIEALNRLEYRKRVIWNIVGDGDEKEKVLKLKKKWDNVNYLGHIENNYIANILRNKNLFISTSRWEGCPNNILEAQAMGLPVLTYNISGCNDIIDNRVNGILVQDINQFKDEIINFIVCKYKFCDIDKYIARKFNQHLIYKQLMDLFKSVVEEK